MGRGKKKQFTGVRLCCAGDSRASGLGGGDKLGGNRPKYNGFHNYASVVVVHHVDFPVKVYGTKQTYNDARARAVGLEAG